MGIKSGLVFSGLLGGQPAAGGGVHAGNDILLRNGTSFLLKRDGTSSLQLGH